MSAPREEVEAIEVESLLVTEENQHDILMEIRTHKNDVKHIQSVISAWQWPQKDELSVQLTMFLTNLHDMHDAVHFYNAGDEEVKFPQRAVAEKMAGLVEHFHDMKFVYCNSNAARPNRIFE